MESGKTSRKRTDGVATLHWSLMRQRARRKKVKVKLCSADAIQYPLSQHRKWLSTSLEGESIFRFLIPSLSSNGWKTQYTWYNCYSHSLTFHHLISALITKCSRSLYALMVIRAHGLNGNALWDIIRATPVSQLQYACPAVLGGDISKRTKGTGFSASYPRL